MRGMAAYERSEAMTKPAAVHLYHSGDTRGDHTFYVRAEESSGQTWYSAWDRDDLYMPWLRGMCSCGWSDKNRYTIEENVHYFWLIHAGVIKQ